MSTLANATNSNYFTYTSPIINLKATGDNLIFTTIAGYRFCIVTYDFFIVSATAPNSDSVSNIGWTAAAYSDFITATGPSSVVVNEFTANTSSGAYPTAPPSTGVYLRVTTADTGTALTAKVILTGFYV